MTHPWFRLAAALLALALPPTLDAQERPGGTLSFDATAGVGTLSGGDFLWRASKVADATLAVRVREMTRGALLVAVSGSVHAPWGDMTCPIFDGPCPDEHPVFASIGTMVGLDRATSGPLSLRVLAGPALYRVAATEYGDDDVTTTFGAQLRGDLALRTSSRVAIVLSARGAYLPDLEGDAVGLGALGLGLRLR